MTVSPYRLVALLLVVVPLAPAWSLAQNVGDRVILVERALGIPGHPSPGNNAVSHRFPGGITVRVTTTNGGSGWLAIEDDQGNAGWIVPKYVASVVPAGIAVVGPALGGCYEIGTWNLEHFGKGKKRGFPENTQGGPTYPPRTSAQLTALATTIRDVIKARILVLTEINGQDDEDDESSTSEELDDLVGRLGPSFQYVITRAGGAQRIALLYDTRFARLNAHAELELPNTKVQKKGLFDRQPLMGHFTFIQNGQFLNDLLVLGLHLASGQHLTTNHDQAMSVVRQALIEARQAGTVLPSGDFDIILAGDLNASWFDDKIEQFFDEFDTGDWKVLAKDSTYPATRLASVPLEPRSQIDYIIVTRHQPGKRGLFGQEIMTEQASVHQELADGDWDDYRLRFSDHFPVTTCVAVVADDD